MFYTDWRRDNHQIFFCFRHAGESLISSQKLNNKRTGTRSVSPREYAPPPKPCFRENRWALKSGVGPCYLRSSYSLGHSNGCEGDYSVGGLLTFRQAQGMCYHNVREILESSLIDQRALSLFKLNLHKVRLVKCL